MNPMPDGKAADPEPHPGGETTPENESALQALVESLDDEGQKIVKSSLSQKEWFRKKSEEARAEADQYKREAEELRAKNSPAPKEPPKPEASAGDQEWRQRIEFGMHNRDLGAEDIDELASIAKGKGLSLEEASKSKAFQGYLSIKKSEAEANGGTPAMNGASPKYEKDEDFAKVTAEDITAMDEKTFQRYQTSLGVKKH